MYVNDPRFGANYGGQSGSAPVLTGWMPTSSVAAIFGWVTVGALPLLRLRLLAVSHSLRSG